MNAVVKVQKTAYERLKRRHQRFVDAYVSGLTGAAAMRATGNKSKQGRITAHRWLHDPDIKAAIAERTSLAVHDAGVSIVEVMRHQAAVATSDIRSLTKPDGTHKAPHELDEATARAIKSYELEEVSTGGRTGFRHKYQFHDKNRAAEFIGRALAGIGGPSVAIDARTINNNAVVVSSGLPRVTEFLARFARGPAKIDTEAFVQDGSVLPDAVHVGKGGSGE